MELLTVERILRALEESGETKTKGGLATAMGIGASGVSSLLSGGRLLKVDEVPAIVEYLELDRVPLAGKVGAGGDIEPFYEQAPPEGWDLIQVPFISDPDMIALRVDGDSMPLRYDEGDTLIVWKSQRRPVESFFGKEAAVLTEDGRRMLKKVMQGSRRGTFDLHSYDGRKPISGVKLEWIGEIYQTLRKDQLDRYKSPQGRRTKPGGRR